MPHRYGVPKYGRETPSMWGNPLFNYFEKQQTIITKPVNKEEVVKTLRKKVSTDSDQSPKLSNRQKRRSNNVVHTCLNEFATLHKNVEDNPDACVLLARMQACRDDSQRIEFVKRYEAEYPMNLKEVVQKIAPNGCSHLAHSLISTSDVILINSIIKAVDSSIGTIDFSLIEILFMSSSQQLQQILSNYHRHSTGASLKEDIMNNMPQTNFQKLCLAILENGKLEDDEDRIKANADAKALILANKSERAAKIIHILTANSFAQINCFIQEFNQVSEGKSIYTFISKEIPKDNRFSDSFTMSLGLMFSLVEDRFKTKADRLIKSLSVLKKHLPHANPGLNVIRSKQVIDRLFLVEREDMQCISQEVYEKEGITLRSLISESVKEKQYQNMLVSIVDENRW